MSQERLDVNPTPDQAINIPLNKLGQVRWKYFRDTDPQGFAVVLENKVREALSEIGTNEFSSSILRTHGFFALVQNMKLYYPGGIRAVRTRLALESQRRNWQTEGAEEIIKEEARGFLQTVGRLTQSQLSKHGRTDLQGAIKKYYPGGLRQLQTDLDITPSINPGGFWTPETIEKAVQESIDREGNFIARKRSNLYRVISQFYPGGIEQLRLNLGLKRQRKSSWEVEEIKSEVQAILGNDSSLTVKLLFDAGRGDLLGAIKRIYPGGLNQLRRDLNLDQPKKPDGYWTEVTIEQEAREFLEQNGSINAPLLKKACRYDLLSQIMLKYPGRLVALKTKLGITTEAQISFVSPEEANADLARLLEEKI
jgi:hypothetical protein